MTAILTQDPPELIGSRPDLSPALDRIIRHCLEKNANERFQNARDVAFALDALSGSTTSSSSGAVGAMPAGSAVRRPRASLVMAAAVVGALVIGAGAGYLGRGTPGTASAGIADVSYQPVSFEDGFVFAARFAPDNRTVVYSADWDRQPRGVYQTSLDSLEYGLIGFPGSDLLGLSRAGGAVYAWMAGEAQPVKVADGQGVAISPDGSRALVTSVQSPPKISIVPTGAGQPQEVDIGPVESVSWAGWLAGVTLDVAGSNLISPQGTHIAAVDAGSRMVVCTIVTPTCQPVPGVGDDESVAGWSTDGRELVIYHPEDELTKIGRIDITTGRRTPLTTIRPLAATVSGIRILVAAPDGAMAYHYDRNASQLYVIKGLK